MQKYWLVLFLSFIVITAVEPAYGLTNFSLDFEDGFQASSGNEMMCRYATDVSGARADDTEIRIVYDADKDSNVVQVGVGAVNGSPNINALLNYFPGIYTFSHTGEVTFKFKITNNYTLNDSVRFLTNIISTYTDIDFWSIGLVSRTKVIAVSYNGTKGASSSNQLVYAASVPSLANGWHTMKFTWSETVAQTETVREQADIRMYVDDMNTPVLSRDDVYWSKPGGGNVCIGSEGNFGSSSYTTAYEAGGVGHGILLDDIVVTGEPTTVLTPKLGQGTQTWLLYDSENGFNASSGTAYAYDSIAGQLTDPNDSSKPIYVLHDAVKDSNVLNIGTSSSGSMSYLTWNNLAPTALGVSGRAKCAFKMPDTYFDQGKAILMCAKEDENARHYWYIRWVSRDRIQVVWHDSLNDPTTNYMTVNTVAIPYDGKWHSCEFTWQQTSPYIEGESAGRANLRLYIDDYLAMELVDTNWVRPQKAYFSPGSFWHYTDELLAVFYEAGDMGFLLDDVICEAASPVGICGDASTFYFEADLNSDCYVDFKDLKLFAEQWLDAKDIVDYANFANEWLFCTDPANSKCDNFWSSCDPIVLQQEERTVTNSQPIVFNFDLPLGDGKRYLSLDGRYNSTLTNGFKYCVRYYVNGMLLSSIEKMVNVPDPRDLVCRNGESKTWIGVPNNWALPYSPNFNPLLNTTSNPIEMGSYPYRTVLDITDYVVSGSQNMITIQYYDPDNPAGQLIFKNVELLCSYRSPDKIAGLRDEPDVIGPVVPEKDFNVPYAASLTSGGGVITAINGEQYHIDSKFSYPNGTFNSLKSNAAASGEWTVVVAPDGNSLTATGLNYILNRSLVRHSDRIDVLDTITNRTAGTIGIRFGHEINEDISILNKTYMAGMYIPYKQASQENYSTINGNPTVYVSKSLSGLGLLARDKVFRAHISLLLQDHAFGIHDKYFALPEGQSYTTKWAIYPTKKVDYYDFINAARRTVNANYLIDGSVISNGTMVGNMNGVSDQYITDFVRPNGAKYFLLSTSIRVDSAGNRITTGYASEKYTYGTAFSTDWGYWTKYYLENTVIPRMRNVLPDVTLITYSYPFSTCEPNAIYTYSDEVVRQSNGQIDYYSAPEGPDDSGIPFFYPTLTNEFGIEHAKVYDFGLAQADGIYLDSFSMENGAKFNYASNMWDNHSCQMDLGSGGWDETGATYALVRLTTSSCLYSLDYRQHQIQRAKQLSKAVWANYAPGTEESTQLQAYHIIEATSRNNNAVFAHLTTPLSMANDYWSRVESDIGLGVKYKLLSGGLYIFCATGYNSIGNGNILIDMYPFDPVELHCGYLLGTNKIITSVPGEYGFGYYLDPNQISVRVYDKGGFRKLPDPVCSTRYDVTLGSTLVNVVFDASQNEMAIIMRQ